MTTFLRRTPRQRRAHARARYEDRVIAYEQRTGRMDLEVWSEGPTTKMLDAAFGPPMTQIPVGPLEVRTTTIPSADEAMRTYKDRV